MLTSIKHLISFFLLAPLFYLDVMAMESCEITKTIQSNEWTQIGIPCEPPQDKNTLKDILSDDILGDYTTQWTVYTFNLITNEYDLVDLDSPLQVGKGYWIIQLNQDVQLDMPEGSQPVNVKNSSQCLTAGCFESTVVAADNEQIQMLSNPFYHPIKSESLRVNTGEALGLTLLEASEQFVENKIWHYNGVDGYEELQNGTIPPWTAWWMSALPKESNAPDLKLLLPTDNGNADELEIPAILPKDAARFLTQSTFGPTVNSIQHLVELENYEEWIDEQVNLPSSYHRPSIKTSLFRENGKPSGQFGRMNRWWDVTVFSDDQLRQRVAFALSEIFVVSDFNSSLKTPRDMLAEYNDILVRHSFGNFRDLLEDVTLSPAMAVYLSMLGNSKPKPSINRRADENYAREILQLFSIGLIELKNNGLPRLGDNGKPVETYSQDDIVNLARIFTGWAWDAEKYIRGSSAGNKRPELVNKPLIAFDRFHDQDEKIFLGVTFPAGQTAEEDLELALNTIFNHRNIGPFIGKQLIMRLVTSNPSPGYVSRVTRIFNNNGEGVRGDLKEVVKAILLDPEARGSSGSIKFGKLKEPLIRLTHLWRAFHASPRKKIAPKHANYMAFHYYKPEQQLSQAPLRSPSVFNFFRPDFSPLGKIKEQGLVAPEFKISSESRLQKLDDTFISFATVGGFKRTDPVKLDLTDEVAMIDNPEEFIEYLDVLLTSGSMSTGLKKILLKYLSSNRIDTNDDEKIVRNIIALIISSAEYSIQR